MREQQFHKAIGRKTLKEPLHDPGGKTVANETLTPHPVKSMGSSECRNIPSIRVVPSLAVDGANNLLHLLALLPPTPILANLL